MTTENHSLLPDRRWAAFRIHSADYFVKQAESIVFVPAVPEAVVLNFVVIKKLIVHSYFAYEFLDVAFDRALLMFEMALRQRYEELDGQQPKKGNLRLENLIKWGAARGLFEADEQVLHSLRRVRNFAAHPTGVRHLGLPTLDFTLSIVDIINGLYEDVDVRRARKDEEKLVNGELEAFVRDGAILEREENRLIIFSSALLTWNNKSSPPVYYFVFWPIFNPEERNNSVESPDPVLLICNRWDFSDGAFSFHQAESDRKTRLIVLDKPQNVEKFAAWRRDFQALDESWRGVINHSIQFETGALRRKYRGVLATPSPS